MAKTRKFKCSKCDRRFKMAAHLARHTSTIHAAKRKAKSAKKKATKRPVSRRSMMAVGAMIGQFRQYRRQLRDQRETLDSQIVAIDNALAAIGSA